MSKSYACAYSTEDHRPNYQHHQPNISFFTAELYKLAQTEEFDKLDMRWIIVFISRLGGWRFLGHPTTKLLLPELFFI